MKDSFVYHIEWFEVIEDLEPAAFAEMNRAIILYATQNIEPSFSTKDLALLFRLIRRRIDSDNAKYQETSDKKAQAGKLGAEKRWQTKIADDGKNGTCHKRMAKIAKDGNDGYIDIDIDNDIDNDIEDIEKKDINISQKKRFVKPTPEEVDAYCKERCNNIKGEDFCNYYEAKGWLVGKSPMKDWRAAVRTWERNRKSDNDDKGDKYDWGNDPDLPEREEWEAFLKFVNKHGGLTLTPYQYSDIKVQAGFNDLSKQQLADVIVECCKRGKNYLADNLQWKLSEVIRYIKNRNNE